MPFTPPVGYNLSLGVNGLSRFRTVKRSKYLCFFYFIKGGLGFKVKGKGDQQDCDEQKQRAKNTKVDVSREINEQCQVRDGQEGTA